MCSILAGCYEASFVLLAAGARTDLKNARSLAFVKEHAATGRFMVLLGLRLSPTGQRQPCRAVLAIRTPPPGVFEVVH